MNTWLSGRALLVFALIAPAFSGSGALVRQEYTEIHMGMPVRIALYAADERIAREASRAAFDRIAALDRMMSDYRADSELADLHERPGEWVPATVELFDVMTRALEIAAASDGAFDPTVGPLVALWREARRSARLPDRRRRDAARTLVGWRLVAIDRPRLAIRLTKPRMRLDLGGIAKGYILQDALGTLRAHASARALLSAGGDIVAGDAPPHRPGWQVDVPGADEGFAARAAALANAALATSGPTTQFVVIDGTRYSHVVDPRTGVGVTNGIIAHVIAADGATADALATAVAVLGVDEGRTLASRFPSVLVSAHR